MFKKTMALLKRRVNNTNGSGNSQSHLPLTRNQTSSASTEKKVHNVTFKRRICMFIGRSIFKFILLIVGIMITIVLVFFIYAYGMGKYNARNAKDPCFVAENSKQTLNLLKKSGRTLNKPIRVTDKFGSTVNGLSTDGFEPKLPKIIHQQWKDQNIPKKFIKWRKKWLEFFPEGEYQYMLWDDESGRQLIKDHYPWFLPTFDGYAHNINRVDATRYFILYHYGGIYADLDYEPTLNFFDYLPNNMAAVIESPYFWNERTQNALMSSPKLDPFWHDVFQTLIRNAMKSNILEVSGPILMDQAIASSSSPAYVLPCENFQRVPLGEFTETLHSVVAEREMIFRLRPLHGKHCGFYSDDRCHFGKHHNTVSYVRTKNNGGGIL